MVNKMMDKYVFFLTNLLLSQKMNFRQCLTWKACEYLLLWGIPVHEDRGTETNMLSLLACLYFQGPEQNQENFQNPSPEHYPLHFCHDERAHQMLLEAEQTQRIKGDQNKMHWHINHGMK